MFNITIDRLSEADFFKKAESLNETIQDIVALEPKSRESQIASLRKVQLKVSVDFKNKGFKEKQLIYTLNKYCEQLLSRTFPKCF